MSDGRPAGPYPAFYEAAIDEVECGYLIPGTVGGCREVASVRIEWADGKQSVACDPHAAAARQAWQRLIRSMSTWPRPS